jgi:hypothetical protein
MEIIYSTILITKKIIVLPSKVLVYVHSWTRWFIAVLSCISEALNFPVFNKIFARTKFKSWLHHNRR